MQNHQSSAAITNCNNFKKSLRCTAAHWLWKEQITSHVSEANLAQNDPDLSSLLIVQPRVAGNKEALVAEIPSLISSAFSHLSLSDSCVEINRAFFLISAAAQRFEGVWLRKRKH